MTYPRNTRQLDLNMLRPFLEQWWNEKQNNYYAKRYRNAFKRRRYDNFEALHLTNCNFADMNTGVSVSNINRKAQNRIAKKVAKRLRKKK